MKTALVTGGNKGIGLAVCRGLAEKGFKVFLGSRDAAKGKAAREKLHAEGYQEVELLTIDVGIESSIQKAAAELSGKIKALNVLVNNAGVYLDDKSNGMNVAPKTIFETMQVNTIGPLLVTRAFAPLLANAGGAEVINVSSGMGQLEDMNGGSAAYRISKTALNAVTRILAHELADQKIHINSVCPGWVKTEMGGAGASRSPEEGADTIIWLAGGESMTSGEFFRDRKKIGW